MLMGGVEENAKQALNDRILPWIRLVVVPAMDQACGCLQSFAAPPQEPGGCLQSFAAPPQDSMLSGVPVVLRSAETACVASTREGSVFDVEWIADSGASRSLASVRSLIDQGISENTVHKCLEPASTIRFETGNGTTNSTEMYRELQLPW